MSSLTQIWTPRTEKTGGITKVTITKVTLRIFEAFKMREKRLFTNRNFQAQPSRGMTFISTLISIAIMGITFSAIVSIISTQSKENLFIRQKLVSTSIERHLLKTLQDSEKCVCHFDPTQNDYGSKLNDQLNIDTTQNPSHDIELGSLRDNCNFSDDQISDIIVKKGKEVRGGLLKVKSIKVSNVHPTGTVDQYGGDLIVEYDEERLIRAIRPIRIPLVLSIDSTYQTEAGRNLIASCWKALPKKIPCHTTDHNGTAGRTLIGCRGTSDNEGSQTTILGFGAGKRNGSVKNTIIGHIFPTDPENVLSKSAPQNVIIGSGAGDSNTGAKNILINHRAGIYNKGYSNIIIGTEAGLDMNLGGVENIFIGKWAGRANVLGAKNVFIGYHAGSANIGYKGHPHNGGHYNTFIGAQAATGSRSKKEGGGHVFIGRAVASDFSSVDITNQFAIGNGFVFVGENQQHFGKGRRWLNGTIGEENLYVDQKPAATTSPDSSRALKKNIKPFKDFKRALGYLLKTPLFTYEYKHKLDHPEKSRMGIISEKLPEYLQLKREGYLSYPDWPSIYGSFWAGIKALHGMLGDLREEVFSKVGFLESHLENLQKSQEEFIKELLQVQSELATTKEELLVTKKELQEQKIKFNQIYKKLRNTKRAFEKMKKVLQRPLAEIMRELPHTKKMGKDRMADLN